MLDRKPAIIPDHPQTVAELSPPERVMTITKREKGPGPIRGQTKRSVFKARRDTVSCFVEPGILGMDMADCVTQRIDGRNRIPPIQNI